MIKAPGAKCFVCPLAKEIYVPSEIRPGAKVLAVGEAPGYNESHPLVGQEKAPFLGDSGKLLDGLTANVGHTREEMSLTNIVACRPPQNREPTSAEMLCCAERLKLEMAQADPDVVLLLGKVARDAIMPPLDATTGEQADFRDYVRADGPNGREVVYLSTWHPAYVLRRPAEVGALTNDLRKAFEGVPQTELHTAPECRIAKDYDDLARMLSECPDNAEVSYDLETNQLGWYDRPTRKAYSILMAALTWDTSMGIVINDELLYDDPRVPELLTRFMEGKRAGGHNVKFDNVFLRAQTGTKIVADWDTMLMHYLTDENSKHGLKGLAWEEFGIRDYEKKLVQVYLNNRNDEYSKVPFEDLAQYGCWDVAVTLGLKRRLQPRLEKDGMMEWPYNRIIMPINEVFTKMQLHGIKVDIPYLQQCQAIYQAHLEKLRYEAGVLVGKPDINLNSPIQVAVVLYDQLKLPMSQSRKVKPRSTSAEAVYHLRGKHPFVTMLMKYRSIAKLLSSYIDNMIDFADVNGYIHPDFLIHGTEMGRISLRDPAAQTIPRPGNPKDPKYDPFEDGAVIRGSVIASLGHVLTITDFSQAELRVLGALANETFLIDAYKNGRDIHSEVALAMFGPNYTKEERVMCKMFNFAYVYGGNEHSFAEDAGLPIKTAIEFVRRYDATMPRAKQWKGQQLATLKRDGFVQSRFGRRRRFPLITQDNVDEARKASVHAVVAGTASDLGLLSMIELDKAGVPCILPVHDSIITDSPEDKAEEHAQLVAETMRSMGDKYLPEVPWKVDTEINYRWVKPPELSQLSGGHIEHAEAM